MYICSLQPGSPKCGEMETICVSKRGKVALFNREKDNAGYGWWSWESTNRNIDNHWSMARVGFDVCRIKEHTPISIGLLGPRRRGL